jgi:hypothetical protein
MTSSNDRVSSPRETFRCRDGRVKGFGVSGCGLSPSLQLPGETSQMGESGWWVQCSTMEDRPTPLYHTLTREILLHQARALTGFTSDV